MQLCPSEIGQMQFLHVTFPIHDSLISFHRFDLAGADAAITVWEQDGRHGYMLPVPAPPPGFALILVSTSLKREDGHLLVTSTDLPVGFHCLALIENPHENGTFSCLLPASQFAYLYCNLQSHSMGLSLFLRVWPWLASNVPSHHDMPIVSHSVPLSWFFVFLGLGLLWPSTSSVQRCVPTPLVVHPLCSSSKSFRGQAQYPAMPASKSSPFNACGDGRGTLANVDSHRLSSHCRCLHAAAKKRNTGPQNTTSGTIAKYFHMFCFCTCVNTCGT